MVCQLSVATPHKNQLGRLIFLTADRCSAWRAPVEQLVNLFGDVAQRRLPIIKEDLHTDRLRCAAFVFRLATRFIFSIPSRGMPVCTLAHGVLAWVELELQAACSACLLKPRTHHL